jgi:hypothetical protein
MARGKTLGDCLTGLRTELRLSLNPAHNVQVRDTHVAVLQRVQEWLWDNYSWPHLRVERYLQPQIGQRFYDPAGCLKIDQTTGLLVVAGDVAIDRIAYFTLRFGGRPWIPVAPGITAELFNQFDSDAGERSWPVKRWQIAENNNVELWPVPDQNGNTTTLDNMLRFVGTRNLASFTEETERADLDDQALIMFAAAKLAGSKDGASFLAQAQQRMRDIRANANPRRRVRVFGKQQPQSLLHGPPTVYYRTTP